MSIGAHDILYSGHKLNSVISGSKAGSLNRVYYVANLLYRALRKSAHILKRIDYDVVKHYENGELDKKGETASHGVEAFLLIKLLYLSLHFLLGWLVLTSRILLAYSHFLGTELCLLYGILLLLNSKGQHEYFDDYRKDKERYDILISNYLVEQAQKQANGLKNKIKH